jgi:transcriptional regulator with XRE-family HTH domain
MNERDLSEQHIEITKRIGDKIKRLRKERGVSYVQLASILNINKNTYYQIETGANFQIRTLLIILDHYKLTLSDFFQDFK